MMLFAAGATNGGNSPNNVAALAGFALTAVWILICVVLIVRHRRRQPVPPRSNPVGNPPGRPSSGPGTDDHDDGGTPPVPRGSS